MDVRVDETGQEGGVAEVEHARAGGHGQAGAHGLDRPSLHHDHGVAHGRLAAAVEEPGGLDDDDAGGSAGRARGLRSVRPGRSTQREDGCRHDTEGTTLHQASLAPPSYNADIVTTLRARPR